MDEDNTVGEATDSRSFHGRRRPGITRERRRQLADFAFKLANDVEEHTQPHERCLLRRMTENILGDDD